MQRLPGLENLRNPWLIAVWPGMGNVAATAGASLGQILGPRPVGELDAHDYFSVDHVEVQGGIARPGHLPRSMFFLHRDPRGRRDLVLFIGEAQPATGGAALCERIVEFAIAHEIERVVTFAALGTTIDPADVPRVQGAVTSPPLLAELRDAGVEPVTRGRVGGLNGVLLAAAAERGLDAMCLLGEMPFYAAGVPNPKASLAVLEALARLGDLEFDLTPLEEIVANAAARLEALREQFRRQSGEGSEPEDAVFEGVDEETSPADPCALDPASMRRIEALFEAAKRDRAVALELKRELDRLHAFEQFEDRFLDLFRKAG